MPDALPTGPTREKEQYDAQVDVPVFAFSDTRLESESIFGYACGSRLRPKGTKFSVKTEKDQHTTPQPADGKALAYVVTQEISDPHYTQIGHITTRIGLDGMWVGANHESSYLAFSVEPGDHRVCTDIQSIVPGTAKLNDAVSLSAEAGKIYYFRAELRDQIQRRSDKVTLEAIDPAEGMLLISQSALSMSKPK
jgi:hypothetical protein